MLNVCSLLNPRSVPILPDATVPEWLIKLHSAVGEKKKKELCVRVGSIIIEFHFKIVKSTLGSMS